MNPGIQDRATQRLDRCTPAAYDKRKYLDGSSVCRAKPLSKSNASSATVSKKRKQDESVLSFDSHSITSSSSSKSSEKYGESNMKYGATSKKRREPSKCPYCTVVMTRSHDLRKHVEKMHQGPQEILCHMCNFRATDIVLYLEHENDHLCKCPFCGFVAKNYRGLPRHKTFCRMNPVSQTDALRSHDRRTRRGREGEKTY